MNLLHIEEMTRVMRVAEIIEKAMDMFPKFEVLIFRKTDSPPGDIPQITYKGCDEGEVVVSFPWMLGDTEWFDVM